MDDKEMHFRYGDRELIIGVSDLLSAPTEVIVSPASGNLSHDSGLAEKIVGAAGKQLQQESDRLIEEYGQFESGMAVQTGAGELPFRAVIHAVGPRMGEGDEQYKIEQAVSTCLKLCEINEWESIAFPAISAGLRSVPVAVCAQAFFRVITHFWDARFECSLTSIRICLTEDTFQIFFDAFRGEALEDAGLQEKPAAVAGIEESEAGHISIEEMQGSDEEVESWFNQ